MALVINAWIEHKSYPRNTGGLCIVGGSPVGDAIGTVGGRKILTLVDGRVGTVNRKYGGKVG